jgi:putative restriction endonuclease
MTPDEIKDRFNAITIWQRGDERAPHKPLLAIYAIARLSPHHHLAGWLRVPLSRKIRNRETIL